MKREGGAEIRGRGDEERAEIEKREERRRGRDMMRRTYSDSSCWCPLAGEGSMTWLHHPVETPSGRLHSYNLWAQTLDRWPCTARLSPGDTHFTVSGTNSTCPLTLAAAEEPGGSPSFSLGLQ
ncbi:unnamed protein product [Pleuronectes platessa]|uniref:Uncharacterized protein n=1 Tax=Pleuronectes platessa TaxID=8262 RepID=A0A9N7W0L6_PLEPL|nr:unnamed protein product [Pleuronectes platessa]